MSAETTRQKKYRDHLANLAELISFGEMVAGLDEHRRNEYNLTRTIRRVETIVNFKDEFGGNERPDWSEFVSPDKIWRRYARQDKVNERA